MYSLTRLWVVPLLDASAFPISTNWHNFFFFHYGFVLNLALVYLYIYFFRQLFIYRNRLSIYLIGNFAFLLGFTLLETSVDFVSVGAGFMVELFWINALSNLAILIVTNFFCFLQAWFELQKSKGKIEREKLRAELSALKQQINPHFLFNSLNSLYGIAFENDDDETAEGIAKLSQMMRYLLYEANVEEVGLKKELDYLKTYIDLQSMRVSDQVRIHFEVEGNESGHMIPPMLFQPFVENAFKYGISQVRQSMLDIRFEISPNKLLFQVKNIKHPVIQSHSKHKGIGIKNVKKRLELLLKNRYKLEILDGDEFYTVNLWIDMIDPMRRHLPLLFTKPLK